VLGAWSSRHASRRGPSRLAFRDAQIDVSRRDERVGARVRGGIHARDVGLARQAQIKAVALRAACLEFSPTSAQARLEAMRLRGAQNTVSGPAMHISGAHLAAPYLLKTIYRIKATQ